MNATAHYRSATLLASIAFCFGLAGCGGVYHTETDGNFSAVVLAGQNSGDGIQLQVDGSVGGLRGIALAEAVAAAMPQKLDGAPAHYAPCAAYSECPGDHLVWTFGPPTARPASAYPPEIAVNLNWIGSYRPDPNNVTAKVALFQSGEVVATAAGQTDADSPNDPAFQAMINRMANAVLTGPGLLNGLLY